MGKYGKNIMLERCQFVGIFIMSIFLFIMIRLYFIQIANEDEYKEQVNKQHILNIESSIPRGNIFDRNGIKITNQHEQKVALILKKNVEDDLDTQRKLKGALNYNDEKMKYLLNTSNTMLEIKINNGIDIKKLNIIKDVIIIDKLDRYSEKNLLSHALGYVNKTDNIGLSGVEKNYDKEPLKADLSFGKTPVFVDAKRNIVAGVTVDNNKNNKNIANSLQLTVDYELQKSVEKILDKSKKKGAVVVAEADTGDILSMASRPNINLNNMESDLDKKDGRFFNKALELSYPPGSIFKIPVLLASLAEEDISMNDEIYCKGYEEIGSTLIKCNKEEGHGNITIEEGLYKSCNSAFIQMGKKIGADKIIEMAKDLGFGEKIEVGIEEESPGNLPSGKELLGPAIGNISIGQGAIEVTPMQVTNMMMILANRGIKKDMSLVKGYVTETGTFGKAITRKKEERIISENLVDKVKIGLDKVVEEGTAKNISIESIGGGGGKTGSAEAVLDEKKVTHAWFSGYFPRQEPKYVITVFVESGGSGSGVAAPIFEEIIKEIYKLNND